MSVSNIPQDANPASHGHHHYFFIPINFVVPNAFIQTSPSAAAPPAPQPNITPATQPNAQPSQQPSNNAQPTPVTPVNIFFTFPLTPGQTGTPSQSGIPIWSAYFFNFNGVPFPTQQQTYQGQPPASSKAINALPLVTITPQHVADQVSCAICQDAFTLPGDANATPVRQMPCGHLFCESCLFPWLQQSNTCPTCRFEILTDNNDYNASVRRRMKEREEVCAKKHAEDEKHNDLSCSLAAVGVCRVESTGSRAVKLPRCGHSFHVPCLRTALLIEGHNLDTEAREGSISMYCPSCRLVSTIEAATIALKNEEEQNMKPQEGNVIRNQYKTTVEEVVNDMDLELD
ncbi:hypothetical protein BC936DRAFT_148704 [Jimgerdemannia flammicorona]|uniref:RING-type domain-containing protein n=1 Tax=Jimgerdemannia flammicorona TaxID=994334 RepID=A0A433D2G8_9FUNG|nr:hypothetical protein BC936DRAFT_148704 [Jimgerdemannia flammicorona]